VNVIYLTREGDGTRVAVACGKCGRHASLLDLHAVEDMTLCCDTAAQDAARAARERETAARFAAADARQLAAARRVPLADYGGGYLFWEDGKGHQDGYFSDWDDLRDWCEGEGEPTPAEVWGTVATPFRLDSAEQLIDAEIDGGEHYDGIADHLVGLDALQAALDAFNAAQTACSYSPDYGVRVVLPAAPAGEPDEDAADLRPGYPH
jgi:hypothetical protein